ncbi:YceD family protein [Oricola cellulosilytica]|uniref:DUF177 domain-containing protein n=1 Tax=Oricola cellulosilytica TaxID=1429082 RepID=A0A4R0PDX0_9HYPH|nr:DUF177 domain-containing protein [Oricola cellulosilytica]TCD14395.1 DUF177 domain-containing protein [Oricola cellulosilytica]
MISSPTHRESPISRPITVSVLPASGFNLTIDADESERAALAAAHDLVAVHRFHTDLEIKRWRKDGVRLRGRIQANVEQTCVVTLEPLESVIDAEFDAVFLPEGSKLRRPLDSDGALLIDPNGPDAPETFEHGILDAGAVAEEFFELEIDPFPRTPGAELPEAGDPAGEGSDTGENPFAGLRALKNKL